MATSKLHTGVWVRQLLKGKRNVRISFIPDNFATPSQHTIRKLDDGDKSTWIELLGDPANIDIDAGITTLRFNKENSKCNATWMPNDRNQQEIFNVYEKPDNGNGDGAGGADYLRCMAVNAAKPFIEANATCLSQWLV